MASDTQVSANQAVVGKAFSILRDGLVPYVCRELQMTYGKDWWTEGVLSSLRNASDLPAGGSWADTTGALDIAAALNLFTGEHWRDIMSQKVSRDARTWAMELKGTRNKWAHLDAEDFSDDDTWRALDTMHRLADQIDPEGADEINKLLQNFRYKTDVRPAVTEPDQVVPSGFGIRKQHQVGILNKVPDKKLKSWREIMKPHPDVAQGLYKSAEFAADLNQVAQGTAAPEYQDPVEFFSRTYVTEGMQSLLAQALGRVAGKEGEPVIQLKTAFGGGKTHSMLALFHMLRNREAAQSIPAIREIMKRVGIDEIPETSTAVIVGTALDPAKHKRPTDMPGIRVNTVWGNIAYQLAAAKNDPTLYEYVREADKKGTSPGSDALRELFDAAGPVLILMDELVAYAKLLHGRTNLPAGTFENFIAFIQSLTEAARASRNAVVVASIPESEIEVGGEAGIAALAQIEHTFGRMEAVWKPVAADEGFEIVRRRLFLDCEDEEGREAVCAAFSKMYAEGSRDFPIETQQLEYKRRLLASYPIHPEMFDRLYEDWGDLERFQKTRGVLRLMAAVIHQLWMGGDQSLMIMPGSVPLNEPRVRDELTRYLSDGWNAVVDREIDGPTSLPYQIEQENLRLTGSLAARRVARTVMLGSAPIEQGQKLRGLESARIRLGTVQPGENIALFNDALSMLANRLAYLYDDYSGDRYWYDTRPTLRKTADDKAHQLSQADVEAEIEKRLRKFRRDHPFAALRVAPRNSQDVKDEQLLCLILLPPDKEFIRAVPDNEALSYAQDIVEHHGNAVRVNRNMLLFVAPDQAAMSALGQHVRAYLAWEYIYDIRDELNLGSVQIREAKSRLEREDRAVEEAVLNAYSWLLVPSVDAGGDLREIQWETKRLEPGAGSPVTRAGAQAERDGQLISKWAPANFDIELKRKLWQNGDHIQISQIWDILTTYLYMERLADENVLLDAVREGVQAGLFAYADSWDAQSGQYQGLRDKDAGSVALDGLLVRSDIAAAGLMNQPGQPEAGSTPLGQSSTGANPPDRPASQRDTHFYMNASLDPNDIAGSLLALHDAVIKQLQRDPGSKLEVTLDVVADNADGFDTAMKRNVSENCRTLEVDHFGFEA